MGGLRQCAERQGLVAELAFHAFPSRRFPLAWQALAKLPDSYQVAFGTRFTYPLWGRGWDISKRAAAEAAARHAIRRVAEHEGLVREADPLGVAGPGEASIAAIERALHETAEREIERRLALGQKVEARERSPLPGTRARWLFPEEKAGLRFHETSAIGVVDGRTFRASVAACLVPSGAGGIVAGIGAARTAALARDKALFEARHRKNYLDAVASGREQLMPRRALQRAWLLSRDARVAAQWRRGLVESRHPEPILLPDSKVKWIDGPWGEEIETCRLIPKDSLPESAGAPSPLSAALDEIDVSDERTWRALWSFHGPRLRALAPGGHRLGMERLGLSEERCPSPEVIREITARETGWQLVPVRGEVPTGEFFEMLASRRFPLSTNLRPREQLFAAADPDLWHEVIGHLCLLWDERASELYETLGRMGHAARADDGKFSLVEKLYWYLAEYGLVRSEAGRKIVGAGLLASPLGVEKILLGTAAIRRFSLGAVAEAPFRRYAFQSLLFEMESIEAALSSLKALAA